MPNTEHRDTLQFLVNRLGGMGFTGQSAQIHGGMDYVQREEEVGRFRKPSYIRWGCAIPHLHGRSRRRHQPSILLDHD